jgi:hypothetical protein
MHESDVWALFVKIGFLIEVKFLFVSRPKTRARPTEERFLLRVDGQIKRSFSSKEDATTAGAVKKKGLSARGRYRCRYGRAHHRDHQRLANCYRPILFSRCDRRCAALTQSGHYAAKHSWLCSAVDVGFLAYDDKLIVLGGPTTFP